MELQLQITTDLASLPEAIEFNYDELKAGVSAYLERFDGLVVTEDGIGRAKEDRAEINRMVEAISRARIDTKKRMLAPFESFEAKAKELEDMGKRAADGIAAQLAEFERRRMGEKRSLLVDAFNRRLVAVFGEDMASPERATSHWREWFAAKTNPKTPGCWLNKGVTPAKAEMEMNAEVQRCADVLRSVRDVYAGEDAEVRTAALFAACKRFDITDATAEVARFRRQREAAERARAEDERRRREEEARRAEAEAEHEEAMRRAKARLAQERATPPQNAPMRDEAHDTQSPVPASPTTPAEPSPETPPPAKERHYYFVVRMQGSASALRRVGEAMRENGVVYERLEYGEIEQD